MQNIKFKIKNLFFLAIILASFGFVIFPQNAKATGWLTGWAYRKKITISKTNVGADLSYFPLLVKIAEVGGGATNIGAHARADGYDVRFTSSDGSTILPYEREAYSITGNNLTASMWVRVPTIATLTNTDIYMYYTNASAITDWTIATSTITNCISITNAQCTWKENATQSFLAVYHLKETGTNPTVYDSTSNANNSTSQTWTPATGQVGGGASFDNSNQAITLPANFSSLDSSNTWTISAWFKSTAYSQFGGIMQFGSAGFVQTKNTLFGLIRTTGSVCVRQRSNTTISNNWTYVSGVVNGADNGNFGAPDASSTLYINGSADNNGSTFVSDSGYGLRTTIGKGYAATNGTEDEVRVSNVARSASWVKFEYYNMYSVGNELTFASQESGINPLRVKGTAVAGSSWLAGWQYRKLITIDHTKVTDVATPSSTYANFPVLVSLSGLSNIKTNGADIRFTDSTGGTQLPREIESYGSGNLVAWVKLTLTKDASDSTNDTFYMYYGNSGATEPAASSTYGSQNVWDSNYKGVWHLKDPTNPVDSTSNANNGTNSGSSAISGQINGGAYFNGLSSIVSANNIGISGSGTRTISAWSKPDSGGIYSKAMVGWGSDNGAGGLSAIILYPSNGDCYFNGSGSSYDMDTGVVCNANSWSYNVATYNSPTVTWYRNGSSIGSNSKSLNTTNTQLHIGERATGSMQYLGVIDEVRISNIVRSSQWTSTEYANQNSPSTFLTAGTQQSATNTLRVKGTAVAGSSWLTGWTYRKKITISKTNVSSDLSYFPLLVKVAETGGGSTNIGRNARADGYDIRFTDSTGGTILPYERETYSVSSNNLTANIWVRVPTIATASNTDIYIYYTNASATTDWTTATSTLTNCTNITNAQCTWKENATQNFVGVWHLPDGSSLTTNDSTSNAKNGTNSGVTAIAGKVDGAGSFNGSNRYISLPNGLATSLSGGQFSISAWVNPSSYSGTTNSIVKNWGDSISGAFHFDIGTISSTYLSCHITQSGGSVKSTVSSVSISTGVWAYVACIADGSYVKNYVNSGQSGTPASYDGTLKTSFQYTNIGVKPGDSGGSSSTNPNWFNGLIDEVKISSVARSADWVKFEYYNQSSATNEISFAVQEKGSGGLRIK